MAADQVVDNSADETVDSDRNKKIAGSGSVPQKICGVCGDKALGYNFNALSCESCKAFFRRNALASKEFKCPFTEQCEITVITRRFCQKCRLEKCFAIGMVKEYIMTEEDKAKKRQKIEENRAIKRNVRSSGDETVSSSKHIKLEDNEDSVGSTATKQLSPCSNDESLASNDQLNIQYDILNSTTCSPSHNIINNTVVNNNLVVENQPSNSPIYTNLNQISSHLSNLLGINISPDTLSNFTNSPLMQSPGVRQIMEQFQLKPEDINNTTDIMEQLVKTENVTFKSILTGMPNSGGNMFPNNQEASAVLNKNTTDSIVNNNCDDSKSSPSTSNINFNKARDILEDVERIPIEPNSIESILCEAIKLEFEAYSSVTQNHKSSRELNDVERAKLNELIVANKALHAPIDDDICGLIGGPASLKSGDGKHDPTLVSIINLTAIAIRRLIKMSKKINAFKNMCEEDQVALLKGGCTEMMVLRSTMTYDVAKNTWKIPHSQEAMSSIRADVLKLAKGNIYQEHDRFIRTFDPRWRTDENVILIMSAIVLFTPDRPRVVHADVIKLEQNSYYYLLRRYLESVYPGCEAKSTFLKLIQKIMELHKLSDEVIGVYLDVNPIEPLLIELFDLKQHST